MKKSTFHIIIALGLVIAIVTLNCALFSRFSPTETTEGATELPTELPTTSTRPITSLSTSIQVYYARVDGGTADQCTGLADAPYPGSGTANLCAWSHPFYALDSEGKWILQAGDTLVIAAGSYRMGIEAPNTGWCSMDYPWDCRLPPLPSGRDAQTPTQILGAGWNKGCKNPPELWGADRASTIIDLTNTSNAVVDCLEITDHSGCAVDHCQATVKCQRDVVPYGDFADQGIYAQDSANVTLRHLNIHGLGNGGVLAGRLTNWTVEDVRLAANGTVGWNGDLGEDSSNNGTMVFQRLTVEWNGCPEAYPDKKPANCWGQELCGGYGDGFGEARTGGDWLFEDSLFRYNTSDGLDLLYVGLDHPGTMVEVKRSISYGNSGNQFKIGGSSRLINSLAVGSCAYFNQKPFAKNMGGMDSGNHCRAGGAAVSINLSQGADAFLVNNTIASQGWATVELQCNTKDFADQPPCKSDQRAWIQNSIFYGYQVADLDYDRLADFIGDGDPDHFTTQETVDYNVIFNTEISSPIGAHNLLSDPLFVNSQDIFLFDAHLQPGSVAIDSGIPVGGLNGLVPSDDLDLTQRPNGNGVDRGVYEWSQSGMIQSWAWYRGINLLIFSLWNKQ